VSCLSSSGIKAGLAITSSLPLKSLGLICEKVYVAVGESEDDTLAKVQALDNVVVIPTKWDESLREGGLILSQQTNVALEALRKDHKPTLGAWGIYLQGDEAFHEAETEQIKKDIQQANDQGCDVVRFRYLHFWQSHQKVAINKKWYPQEIRAIKLNSSIESWGDAQSFRNFQKPFESDAHVFHYGHVRDESKYKLKKTDFLKLYHLEDRISKYRRREKRFDDQTVCVNFLGSHPKLLHSRINRIEKLPVPTKKEEVWIVGNPDNYSAEVKNNIGAQTIHWVSKINEAKCDSSDDLVILNPSFFQKILYRSFAPTKMQSKLARPWSNDFYLKIKLFEKGIWVF
jgi:hypothetical protein